MSQTQRKDVRLRTADRSQVTMQFGSVDELVGPDHPVRRIWTVVQQLDTSRFYEPIVARQGVPGRDSTDPKLLISLWLYAATRGVGSARELDRLCQESRPFMWLRGNVSLNYHTLADFRTGYAQALDELFTQVIATLVDKKVIKIYRISQDGTRVRACAGASSFRRSERLDVLLAEAEQHVAELKSLLDDPEKSAGLSARRKAARQRAATDRKDRLQQAIAQMPELKKRQEKRAKKVSAKDKAKGKLKEPRASTTDPEARVMKMPDGGFAPAVNVQFATDTESRAIVGVAVINSGVDTGQSEPMRKQVEDRTGQKVQEQLIDGGYLTHEDVERADEQNVSLYMPPKPPRNKEARGSEFEPMPGDSEAIKRWRARMGSEEGKQIYKQRAATSETVNADTKTHRGLVQLTVRGLAKAQCVALWSALAYNIMHFGGHLIG
jgi:transposase